MSGHPAHNDTMPRQALVEKWRRRAAALRDWGAAEVARVWDIAATELEADERERALEVLTLAEAASESGYSTDHLRRLVRDGLLPNAGRRHAPRIRRRDVPKKPTHGQRKPPRRPESANPKVVRALLAAAEGNRDL